MQIEIILKCSECGDTLVGGSTWVENNCYEVTPCARCMRDARINGMERISEVHKMTNDFLAEKLGVKI